jgi:hypothetical protein
MSEAMLLLRLADALAIKVGYVGTDVITVTRSSVPLEVGRWLHAELSKHKRAVTEIIQQENAARTEVRS